LKRTLFGANDLNLRDFLVSWKKLVTLFWDCYWSNRVKQGGKGEKGSSINGFSIFLLIFTSLDFCRLAI
jgi:hypothetical protein